MTPLNRFLPPPVINNNTFAGVVPTPPNFPGFPRLDLDAIAAQTRAALDGVSPVPTARQSAMSPLLIVAGLAGIAGVIYLAKTR